MRPALVLIGARGAGKSTVGGVLAARLEIAFIDTDRLVERSAGITIARIFAERGEAAFRKLEREVIARVAPTRRQVVACGGGAVLDPENVRRLAALGPVAWLTAPAATLASRIRGSSRPPLTGAAVDAEVGAVLAERASIYEGLATWVVDTEGRTPEEICDELEQLWRGIQDHDIR